MGFDRGWTDGQPAGDLRVVQPFDHQSQNFTFALRLFTNRIYDPFLGGDRYPTISLHLFRIINCQL
jgi:hypothetical protein